jgi:hydrogenase nickel incorporation protein HypA/HybF
MHELSLVRSLVTQVEQLVADHGGGIVREIRLQCGSLSGVEPALMKSAFELLKHKTALGDATLVIEEIALAARCGKCQTMFHSERFHFVCPQCGSIDTEVVQGESVVLESIELEPHLEREFV